jgi:hypothetical protein
MTYRYKVRYAPRTLDELDATLNNIQYSNATYFASFRTQGVECGRPINGWHKLRWFDKKHDPNQLWLPFEDFQPVRLREISRWCGRDYRWYCDFDVGGRTYRADVNTTRPCSGRDTLQALEIYERIREEPQDPFPQSEDRIHRQGCSQDESHGRRYLEWEVSRLAATRWCDIEL